MRYTSNRNFNYSQLPSTTITIIDMSIDGFLSLENFCEHVLKAHHSVEPSDIYTSATQSALQGQCLSYCFRHELAQLTLQSSPKFCVNSADFLTD